MKQFNDAVLYIRNGKTIPAIVLKSQSTPDGELLTLLYADPDKGPGLLAQGTSRGVAQVENAVAPIAPGKLFGWQMTGDEAAKLADEVFGPATPGAPESPHVIEPIMPDDPTSLASVESAKDAALAAEQNVQRVPGPPQPPKTDDHPVA
jgi:hypothetical protein